MALHTPQICNILMEFVCISTWLRVLVYVAQDIRLANEADPYKGRVEVCTLPNGDWGTVCDDLWGMSDAQVACRQLGYSTDGVISYVGPASPYGPGTCTICFDNLSCIGSEASLFECPSKDVQSYWHNFKIYLLLKL